MAPTALHFLVLCVAGWLDRRQADVIDCLLEENRVLREHLGDRRPRFTDRKRRGLAERAARLAPDRLRALARIVRPETLLRWHRRLVRDRYDGAPKRGARRTISPEVRELVVRMARECPRWGYLRIAGALAALGHPLSASSVRRILAAAAIPPVPERGGSTRWSDFLRRHWDGIAAADFFTVEALTLTGLVRYQVLFVIELATRRVHLAGIAHDPGEA